MAVVVRYDAKGVSSRFWQELYGYSKGKYTYPGLLSRLRKAEKLGVSTLVVSERDLKILKDFLKTWRVTYTLLKVEKLEPKIPSEEESLRWDMPIEVLDERLRGFGEKMDELGPFIRTKTVRNALKDVERYGY